MDFSRDFEGITNKYRIHDREIIAKKREHTNGTNIGKINCERNREPCPYHAQAFNSNQMAMSGEPSRLIYFVLKVPSIDVGQVRTQLKINTKTRPISSHLRYRRRPVITEKPPELGKY